MVSDPSLPGNGIPLCGLHISVTTPEKPNLALSKTTKVQVPCQILNTRTCIWSKDIDRSFWAKIMEDFDKIAKIMEDFDKITESSTWPNIRVRHEYKSPSNIAYHMNLLNSKPSVLLG